MSTNQELKFVTFKRGNYQLKSLKIYKKRMIFQSKFQMSK